MRLTVVYTVVGRASVTRVATLREALALVCAYESGKEPPDVKHVSELPEHRSEMLFDLGRWRVERDVLKEPTVFVACQRCGDLTPQRDGNRCWWCRPMRT